MPNRIVPCLALLAFAVACSASASDSPWVVTADSSGDTIQVRISGETPASAIHALVEELRVGAQDGDENETFGSVDAILGTADSGLLIYDTQAKEVRRFDRQGRFVRRIGGTGGGPGEHGHINGLVRTPNDDWVFWDADGARLNRYAEDGTFKTGTRLPIQGTYRQDGLRSDTRGRLYLSATLERDSITRAQTKVGMYIVDTLGVFVDTVVFPRWGPVAPTVTASTADGGSSITWGLPWFGGSTSSLLIDGGLVSGYGLDYAFYLLPPEGKPVRVERELQRVPVSETEANERRAQITQRLQQTNPSWSWTGPALPAVKPAYRDFLAGDDGRVWIRLSTPGEPIPEAELPPPPPGPNPPVRLTTREANVYDVYTADGRPLGRVVPPPHTRVVGASGNHVWGVVQDSLDVSYAVRFRIEPALRP